MALHFDIKINGGDIGVKFVARRLEAVPANGVSRYKVYTTDEQDNNGRETTIRHRYSDGALALVLRALRALYPDVAEIPDVD